jgi:hypothetical protein
MPQSNDSPRREPPPRTDTKGMHNADLLFNGGAASSNSGLKERGTKAAGSFSVFERFKAMFSLSTDKGLRMNSEQRLQLAKLYFDLQRDNIKEIMKDRREGYHSLLGGINDQIKKAKGELRRIERELEHVNDPKRKKDLEEQQDNVMRKYRKIK